MVTLYIYSVTLLTLDTLTDCQVKQLGGYEYHPSQSSLNRETSGVNEDLWNIGFIEDGTPDTFGVIFFVLKGTQIKSMSIVRQCFFIPTLPYS